MTALAAPPLPAPFAYRLEPIAPPSLPSWAAERRLRLAASAVLAALPQPLGAADGGDAYAALLLPRDEPARARRMAAAMSSCALWALALWRLLGAEAPELDAPYRPGSAVSDVVALARRWGAWRAPGADLPAPLPGDVALASPPEHVAVREAPGSFVDGGQGPGGRSIRRVAREFERRGGLWRLGPRPVIGWVDLSAVPLTRPACVPEGVDLTG